MRRAVVWAVGPGPCAGPARGAKCELSGTDNPRLACAPSGARSSSTRSATCRRPSAGNAVRLPADHGRDRGPAARDARASRPQRSRGNRRRTDDPPLDRRTARLADRRDRRRRLRTRRRRRHAARANTIFSFELDGLRVCHFGDFGQLTLREEQAAAIGAVDLLFLPVGDGPTIGPHRRAIVERLRPRWVVPMHYRTPRISFLEPADAFLELFEAVERLSGLSFEADDLPSAGESVAVVPAAP